MKYVGIKNSYYKNRMIEKAKKYGNKVTIDLPCMCPDCGRHRRILQLFDKGIKQVRKVKRTEYYKFSRATGKDDHAISRKLRKFLGLYKSIKKNGYNYAKGYIILTEDGTRLDGSHRACIIEHLKFKKIDVIMMNWRSLFKKSELRDVYAHIKSQKKRYKC